MQVPLADPSPRFWLRAALVAFLAVSALALALYGGQPFWPAIATEFGASLAAFLLALEWEAHREETTLTRADRAATEARRTEARKRLLALEKELKRNQASLDTLAEGLAAATPSPTEFNVLNPELLDGAWASSGERLGDLLADYELVADLATFYGRLEELRWRVRHRTETVSKHLDRMTAPLVDEMQGEASDLLSRVGKEAMNPEVRAVVFVKFGSGARPVKRETAMPITPA